MFILKNICQVVVRSEPIRFNIIFKQMSESKEIQWIIHELFNADNISVYFLMELALLKN